MNPGIHDITIEQYHAGPGLSRSGVEKFRKSPLHYWHEYLNPEKTERVKPEITTGSNALEFGNATHTYLLEPQEFEKRYLIINKPDGRTKEGKAAKAHALVQANGRELICSESMRQITDMHRSINKHATARSMLEGGVNEKSLFWVDKDTGILCKVRPDVWHQNLVVDVKTSTDASFRGFQRSVHQFGYHIQCAMINEALFALKGINMMNFVFVVIEKDAPHPCVVYRLDENAINKGREEFKKALFDIKECMISNEWPAYSDSVIDLPVYAYNNQGEF